MGNIERHGLARLRAVWSPFQEGVPIRIKQVALARRDTHVAVPTAVVNQAKERQQLRPGAIPQVHGVREPRRVRPQPLEQPGDGVGVRVDRITRQQSPVFRIQHEHQAHEHREQAGIDLVRVLGQHVTQ